jgi:RNA polymerase sigma-70 factor (ECF subfamily)
MPGPQPQPPDPNPTDWAPALLLYARSLPHSSALDPADAVQESLLRLLALASPPDDPRAWLFRTLRNLVLSASRHDAAARRARPRLFAPTNTSATPINPANLAAALEQLPQDAREILVLKIWASLTFDQIAAITSLPPATAHRRFRDSLAQLRAALEPPCTSPTTNLKA